MMKNSPAPKAFVSYSHDSEDHRAWVLRLADRMVKNGIDAILDRWQIRYGDDICSFMEQNVTESGWFIAICTPRYVQRANSCEGGAGYEKMILTPSLLKSATEKRVIPVWRDNPEHTLPTFIGSRLAVDFNEDGTFEQSYDGLLRTLHGREIIQRPQLGPNPFDRADVGTLAFNPERYADPNLSGLVTFDYSNNDGIFEIGSGELRFTTHWSRASDRAIHCYRSGNLASVALVSNARSVTEIGDATQYDTSSRTRTPDVDEFVIVRNQSGYYAAMRVLKVIYRGRNGDHDSVTFSYWILPDRSSDFSRFGPA